MVQNELTHHGVKGQRWGVRRFQNKDGSLTAAGKKRLGDNDEHDGNDVSSVKTKMTSSKKSIKDMTDDELQAEIDRLNLEKRYKELANQVNPPKSTEGRDYAVNILKKIGEQSLTNIGTQALTKALGLAINKAFDVDPYDATNRIANPNKGQADKK